MCVFVRVPAYWIKIPRKRPPQSKVNLQVIRGLKYRDLILSWSVVLPVDHLPNTPDELGMCFYSCVRTELLCFTETECFSQTVEWNLPAGNKWTMHQHSSLVHIWEAHKLQSYVITSTSPALQIRNTVVLTYSLSIQSPLAVWQRCVG